MIDFIRLNHKQRHVKRIIKNLTREYPPSGKKHIKFFKELVDNKEIPVEMAAVLTHIIENPNCNYNIKKDGGLVLNLEKQ